MFFNETAEITGKKIFNKDFCHLTLKNSSIAQSSRPGQFVHIKVADSCYPILRRPISICDSDGISSIELFIKIVGSGTDMIANKIIGEKIEALGPLGRPFTISEKKYHILIGGGVGIAPLIFLAKDLKMKNQNTSLFYGGKSASQIPLVEKIKELDTDFLIATEDGSIGKKGLITEYITEPIKDNARDSAFYICGPEKMIEVVSNILKKYSDDIQVSLENRMACGVGACQGCAVVMKEGGYKRVCKEGPVFFLNEVDLM